MAELEKSVYEKTSWDKYLECNPLPDVSQESSLNTYLSMWRDEDDQANPPNLRYKPVIESCSTTERVVDLLEEVNSEAREELQLKKTAWCGSFIHLLRNLTTLKLDQLTAQFLSRYDEFEDHETRVMNVSHNTPDIAFGLWVHNTAKRADGASVRVKRIEFPNIGFNIELPAALQKSRTSIRVIRTLFDHTSIHWDQPNAYGPSQSALNAKIRAARPPPAEALHCDPPEMPDGTEKDLFELARQAEELYNSSIAHNADHATYQSSLQSPGSANLPPPTINFVSVGGIINIEQLALPPPPKKAKGWVMRDITPLSKSIQIVPYPAASEESPAGQSPASAAAATIAHGGALAGATSQAPLRVSFMLPGYVFLDDREPHFGWWDARFGCWRQEGVSLTKYEPKGEGGLVHLSLTLLKPVAIIQPRALDFPFRSWHLKPATTNSQLNQDGSPSPSTPTNPHVYEMMLQGSRFPVEFEIAHDHARLTNPISPVLGELNSQQMLPGILLSRMARAGINVQPSVEDAAYCRKPFKSVVLTAALHEHLALVAGLFEIQGSPFNSSRSSKKALFRVRLVKDSSLLLQAASRRAKLDAIAQAAAEALKVAQGPVVQSTKAEDDKQAMERLIAEMEANDPAAKKAADEAEAAAAAKAFAQESTLALDAPTSEQLDAARQKRHALAEEWVTVMVELARVEPPPPPKKRFAITFAQDPFAMVNGTNSSASSQFASPSASRPETARNGAESSESAPNGEAELPEGTVPEATPGGKDLLKFTLIRGNGLEGRCDETPLEDCVSHFSLRRCLLAYFIHLTPHDLTTAMDMQLTSPPPIPPSLEFLPKKDQPTITSPFASPLASPTSQQAQAAASGATTIQERPETPVIETPPHSLFHPSFLPPDVHTLQIQQTLRRIFNLTNVFTFH